MACSTLCSAEITFKTDPKNTDYVAEHGASRNFEPWRDEKAIEEDRIARMEEEENNPMKALENRTTDSKREMDILDALQDIRSRNARHERIGASLADKEGGIESIVQDDVEIELEETEEERIKRLEEEEDERLVREVFSKVPTTSAGPSSSTAGPSTSPATPASSEATITVKRKAGALPEPDDILSTKSKAPPKPVEPPAKRKKTDLAASLGIKIKKKPVKSLV